jgi:hypothetical protein
MPGLHLLVEYAKGSEMTTTYEDHFAKNVFQQLDDESSLCLLGLCLASNDIVFIRELLDKCRPEEKPFFFAILLSILREIAKFIQRIDGLPFRTHFSQETEHLLQELKTVLLPFHVGSLTKDTLKPVRDFTFHYDFIKHDEKTRLCSLLAETRGERELTVRASSGDRSILGHRYIFADAFRMKYVNSYLTTGTVDQLSAVAVNIIALTDSLRDDLSQ